MVAITALNNASHLLEKLPLATITVVLLTATWSYDVPQARASLSHAAALVACPSVAYYEIPVAVTELHVPAPLPSTQPRSLWHSTNTSVNRAQIAWNVTNKIPWFPCVRVFRGEDFYETHMDTLEPGALANHIEQHCRDDMAKSGDGDGNGASRLSRLSAFTTPVSRDRFAREMNKRAFKSLGVLFFVPGGVRAIVDRYEPQWTEMARAVSKENERKGGEEGLGKRWVISIVDSVEEIDMAERNGVRAGVAVVLVDSERDRSAMLEVTEERNRWGKISEVLRRFEAGGHGRGVGYGSGRDLGSAENVGGRVLSYLEKPGVWKEHFSKVCHVPLRDYMDGRFDEAEETGSLVWVVVHQAWCGLSQRVIGNYRRLQRMGQGMRLKTWVVEVSDTHLLPRFMEEMVDGFPTVIEVRLDGERQTVEEYFGPHTARQLMRRVPREDLLALQNAGWEEAGSRW